MMSYEVYFAFAAIALMFLAVSIAIDKLNTEIKNVKEHFLGDDDKEPK